MKVESFHQVAVGHTKLSAAVSYRKQVFGAKLISQDHNDLENRNAVFLSSGGTIVELFKPTDEAGETAKTIHPKYTFGVLATTGGIR